MLILPTCWVESCKLKASGERVFKSRLVAQGHLDTRLDINTTTGSCPQEAIRLNFLAAMTSPYYDPNNILVCNVTCAFLQSVLISAKTRPVAILPPIGHPDRGKYVWLCLRAVYGLPDGSYCFEVFLTQVLTSLGYVRVVDAIWAKIDPKTKRVLYTITQYADDLMIIPIWGDVRTAEAELCKHLDMGAAEPLHRYVGCDYTIAKDYVRITQKSYIQSIYKPRLQKVPIQPLPSNVLEEQDTSAPLSSEDATMYRSHLGALAFVATVSRPDLSFACAWLSKFNQQPTTRSRRLLDQALGYAHATADLAITIRRPGKDFYMLAHVDASFGSATKLYPQAATY